jgi:hypothetical protein
MRSTAWKADSFNGMTRLLVSFLLVRMWMIRFSELKSFRRTCFTSTPRIATGVFLQKNLRFTRSSSWINCSALASLA